MSNRQVGSRPGPRTDVRAEVRSRDGAGTAGSPVRAAQRRRTRRAIVDAAARLLATHSPTIDEIAAEAEVSRRTVYLHFPTLDQLLLDAAVGAVSEPAVGRALENTGGDAAERADALITTLLADAESSLPLGRQIIRLTVDQAGDDDGRPRRGFRRRSWIDEVLEPLHDQLDAERYQRLASALAVIAGWESMIILRDVCGLGPDREADVLRWMSRVLVQSMVTEAGGEQAGDRVGSGGPPG